MLSRIRLALSRLIQRLNPRHQCGGLAEASANGKTWTTNCATLPGEEVDWYFRCHRCGRVLHGPAEAA